MGWRRLAPSFPTSAAQGWSGRQSLAPGPTFRPHPATRILPILGRPRELRMEVGRQEPDPGNVNELTPPFVTSQLKVPSF